MNVFVIKTGEFKENCFVLSNDEAEALIIDPGDNHEEIDLYLVEKKLRPLAILNTHGHFDHVRAVQALKTKYSIPFILHKKDVSLLKRANLYRTAFVGSGKIDVPEVDKVLEDDMKSLSLGSFTVIIHSTPGHTDGSLCFEIGDYIFTGDTLLSSNLLPKNFPGENRALLLSSLKYLSNLHEKLQMMPGHGSAKPLKAFSLELISKWEA